MGLKCPITLNPHRLHYFLRNCYAKAMGTLRPDTQPSPNIEFVALNAVGILIVVAHTTKVCIHVPSVVTAVLSTRPIVVATTQLNTN